MPAAYPAGVGLSTARRASCRCGGGILVSRCGQLETLGRPDEGDRLRPAAEGLVGHAG